MLKLCGVYLVFGVLFVGFINFGEATHVSQAEWDNYKASFNKSYTNGQRSEPYARYYFAQNRKAIDAHNALYDRGQRSYRLKVNQFTDMRSKHVMQLFPPTRQPTQSNASPLPPPSGQPQPITFDPRLELGLNVSVQDQGTVCNSGWAYATAKSVEVLLAFQMGNLRPATLSAQNLIDCAGSVSACRNQVPQVAFDYLTVHNMDLLMESDYRNDKTSEKPNMCVPSGELVTNLRAYARIPDGQDNTLRTYLANNYPAVIEFNPNSFEFMHYADGIFTPELSKKHKQGSHYMTVIGYGTDAASKLDYWLVLNSWGETWGEDGYIRIARNSNSPLAKSTLLPTEMG